MEAPKCKICGKTHWGLCFTGERKNSAPAADARLEGGKRSTSLGRQATAPASKVSAVPDGGSSAPETETITVAKSDPVTGEITRTKAVGEKRKGDRHRAGYMSEYQRKRRAAAKGTK